MNIIKILSNGSHKALNNIGEIPYTGYDEDKYKHDIKIAKQLLNDSYMGTPVFIRHLLRYPDEPNDTYAEIIKLLSNDERVITYMNACMDKCRHMIITHNENKYKN